MILCPNNTLPGGPFDQAYRCHPKEWVEKAKLYHEYEPAQGLRSKSGKVEDTAWELMYNNWFHYNQCRYAHYYVEVNE